MKRIVLLIGVLVLLALACGSPDNSGAAVTAVPGNTAVTQEGEGEEVETEAAPTTAVIETFDVGEVIEVGDHTITLNEVSVQGNRVIANFTIENKGSADLNVSSLISFEAKDDNGSKLEQDIFDCGTSSMDGSVLPGDKLTGSICWDGLTTDNGRIYYRAELFGSGAVVWAVTK